MTFDQCVMRGKEYFLKRNFAEAANYFKKAIELDKHSAWAQYWLIDSLKKQGKTPDELLQHYDEALQLNKWNALAYFMRNYLRKECKSPDAENDEEILKFCNQALDQSKTSANYFARAYVYTEMGRLIADNHDKTKELFTKAKTDLDIVLSDNIIEDEVYAVLANVLYDLGKTKEAIDYYEKAITLNPQMPEHHFHYGVMLVDLKAYTLAIKHFAIAIWLDPKDTCNIKATSYKYWSYAIEMGGGSDIEISSPHNRQADMAAAVLEKISPKTPIILYKLARLYSKLTQVGKAKTYLSELDTILSKQTDNEKLENSAVFDRSKISNNIGKLESYSKEIKDSFSQYITNTPNEIEKKVMTACQYYELEQYDNSLKEWQAFIKMHPTNSHFTAHMMIAMCYHRKKKYTEAISHYKEVIKQLDQIVGPKKPEFLNMLKSQAYEQSGRACLVQGDYTNTINYFKKAQEFATLQRENDSKKYSALKIKLGKDFPLKLMLNHDCIETLDQDLQLAELILQGINSIKSIMKQPITPTQMEKEFSLYVKLGQTFFAEGDLQRCKQMVSKAIDLKLENANKTEAWQLLSDLNSKFEKAQQKDTAPNLTDIKIEIKEEKGAEKDSVSSLTKKM